MQEHAAVLGNNTISSKSKFKKIKSDEANYYETNCAICILLYILYNHFEHSKFQLHYSDYSTISYKHYRHMITFDALHSLLTCSTYDFKLSNIYTNMQETFMKTLTTV